MIHPIKEDFLHYLWRTKKLNPQDLVTSDGIQIHIVDHGIYNVDSGPDFFNAKVEIGGILWAGNVEMHVFTSDWIKHGHTGDKAYDNVILHVVYEHDINPVKDVGLAKIPTIELKGRIPKIYLERYLSLVQSSDSIPCQRLIKNVDPAKIELWKYTLMVDRLHGKANQMASVLFQNTNDWEETLYIMLARYFGSKVNTEPFEMLAKSLPLRIIQKNHNKALSVEALVFGQAGMLQATYIDEYFLQLQEEYKFLQKKYQLSPINPVVWKFSRMRPVNFPTVRLAQFAALLRRSVNLFSKIQEVETIQELRSLLRAEPPSFWDTHYRFGKESPVLCKNISDEFIDLLMINTIAPILYLYGKTIDDSSFIDKAIHWLEAIKAEKNNIITAWRSAGVHVKTAFDSQALIHLKQHYCDEYRCLDCKIGHEIMGGRKGGGDSLLKPG